MAYEIFTRKVSRSKNPTIAFSKTGRFMLNKAATAQLVRDHVENVLLLWDKDRTKVAVRPITKKDTRSYPVKYATNNSGAYFSAKTFFDHIGISYTKTVTLPAIWNEDETLLEAEIPSELLSDERQQRLIEMDPTPKRGSKAG